MFVTCLCDTSAADHCYENVSWECLCLQFDFNVDSIDDVEEEIFDHLAEDEGYPVTGKGAAATASDFDKELAEFENAFD